MSDILKGSYRSLGSLALQLLFQSFPVCACLFFCGFERGNAFILPTLDCFRCREIF